jgi:hypothetical protein
MVSDDIKLKNAALAPVTRKAFKNLDDEQFTLKSPLLNELVEVYDDRQGRLRKHVYLKRKIYSLIPAIITRISFLAIIVGQVFSQNPYGSLSTQLIETRCIGLGIAYRPFLLDKVQVGILYFSEDTQVAIMYVVVTQLECKRLTNNLAAWSIKF